MKVSYHWLKAYVDRLPAAGELGRMLTMCGLEVEEVQTRQTQLDGVVVGLVEETAPHPNADRLTLCRTALGDGQSVQIVCGAPNVAAGQKVAVARTGATVNVTGPPPERAARPVRIRKARLRGEISEGMICAEDELGLSDDHTGIMVLDARAPVGTPLEQYLAAGGVETGDTVYNLAITPNRPDAVCHMGVARDIAARSQAALLRPDVRLPAAGGPAADAVTIRIACPGACRRYVAVLVRGVRVEASPLWLRRRLMAIGQRPINNVVDITNFVMQECGQPLHAFDLDLLVGATIEVRQATGGESFVTLDGKQREVPAETVLICDAERPIALGGIMGGANSEVSSETVNVLLESAWFDPATTRRSARAMGISTEASYRFERGVDSRGQVWAAARAAQLMCRLGGGAVEDGMVDCHPNPARQPVVDLRPARIDHVLGVRVARGEVLRILGSLGFALEEETGSVLRYRIPPHRPDITREIDLIEEVARIHGYDAVPEPAQIPVPSFLPVARPKDTVLADAKSCLVGLGYREIYTNSLLHRQEAEEFCCRELGAPGDVVETLNAVSDTMTTLRPSLLPGALAAMGFNSRRGQEQLRFFEFGHVFHRADTEDAFVPGYAEHESLLVAASGRVAPPNWDCDPETTDYFDLKGDVEALLRVLRLPPAAFVPVRDATSVTAYHAVLQASGRSIGHVARVAPKLAEARDIRSGTYFAELNWDVLASLAARHLERSYTAVARHPAVRRDIALVVARDVPAGEMLETIRRAGSPLLVRADIFDRFEGGPVGSQKKSLAFSLLLGADRTLTDAEINACTDGIVKELEARFGARLRQA